MTDSSNSRATADRGLSTRSPSPGNTGTKLGVALGFVVLVGYLAYASYRGENVFSPVFRPATESAMPSVSAEPVPTQEAVVPSVTVQVPPSPAPMQAVSAPVTEMSRLLASMNARRATAGLPPLAATPLLGSLAQAHVNDMVARGYFAHTTPDGVTFEQRVKGGGYTGSAVAENIGLTSEDVIEIVAGWMDSPAHRDNLLNDTYAAVGIGIAHGTWQNFPVVFAVSIFGNAKE